jgi:hypothetical protein
LNKTTETINSSAGVVEKNVGLLNSARIGIENKVTALD